MIIITKTYKAKVTGDAYATIDENALSPEARRALADKREADRIGKIARERLEAILNDEGKFNPAVVTWSYRYGLAFTEDRVKTTKARKPAKPTMTLAQWREANAQ